MTSDFVSGLPKKSIVVVQPCIPDYRLKFFQGLNQALEGRLQIFAGKENYDGSIKSVDTGDLPVTWISCKSFLGGKLFWNVGITKAARGADVVVLGLNPRLIDSWYLTVLRRLQGRKVVLWGHCWPRTGRKSPSDVIRGMMRRLPDSLIVYTETEERLLSGRHTRQSIHAARNAIYYQAEMQPVVSESLPSDVIYVGRIAPEKKIAHLIRSFAVAIPSIPTTCCLQIVGDGPERAACESLAFELRISDRVIFHGHVSDIARLRQLYAESVCSVSSGFVGLSITQSLGFGIPMIVSRDEPHAPEIEALVPGENGAYFETDDETSLATEITKFVDSREKWASKRSEISERCRSAYSLERMIESMVNAIL